jgi:hypothetical protein
VNCTASDINIYCIMIGAIGTDEVRHFVPTTVGRTSKAPLLAWIDLRSYACDGIGVRPFDIRRPRGYTIRKLLPS